MYRQHAYAALAVGADAIAAADTRRYLEITGWSDSGDQATPEAH